MTLDRDEIARLLEAATPGPWRLEQDTTLIWGDCDADDMTTRGMGYPIAEARILKQSSWAKGPDADQGEANAALIAHLPFLASAYVAPNTGALAVHPDDLAVDRFALAMKSKLAKGRAKGRSGWDDPNDCSDAFLAELFVGHLAKENAGNFEDLANILMMLHQRNVAPAVLRARATEAMGKRDK